MTAKYEKFAEIIRGRIRSGELEPDEMLPGYRVLAEQVTGYSPGTVQKALQVLLNEGWLSVTPAVGYFVNRPPAESPDTLDFTSELAALKSALGELTERVERLETGAIRSGSTGRT
ncbi:winged helix-turn-helix domain-containing protein [Amycolatopsis sp. NPDC102389]|uniref:winged helix-turn-helix domain-containing protein n=1 Tax=Amycolatopsis sp. NPDC102389 TaxID=3363941 RepID=UPI0037FD21B2